MKIRQITWFASAIAIAVLLFTSMVFATQRAGATDGLSSALNSPLNSPLTLPDDTQLDTTNITFTPAFTIYLPIVSRSPNYRFGTEVDSEFADYRGAKAIKEAGFGWYRHMQINWVDYEPTPGQYITTPSAWDGALDAGIARATASGLKTIVVIRNSPAWATTSGISGCASVKPSAYITLANFVNWVVSKYEQAPYYVTHYELWNEPDATGEPADSTERGCWSHASEYVNMLKTVYPAVKEQHPQVKILNGGLGGLFSWAHEFITSGMAYIDVLAYHAYDYITVLNGQTMWENAQSVVPTVYQDKLATIRGWLSSTYSTTNIFMDEGAAIPAVGTPYTLTEAVIRIQAYFAAYMTAQIVGEDLELYSWWVSYGRSSSYGTSYENSNPRYYVTNTLHTALAFGIYTVDSATYVTSSRNTSGASIIKLRDEYDKDLWLLWNTNGSNSSSFTHNFGFTPYKVWDVWGNILPITSTFVMTDPVRVVWVQPYE